MVSSLQSSSWTGLLCWSILVARDVGITTSKKSHGMTEHALAEKRITFGFEFSRFLMAHPKFATRIPRDAAVVFLVDDDPVFTRRERTLAKRLARTGQPVVTVHVQGLAPPLESRLINPDIRLTPTHT